MAGDTGPSRAAVLLQEARAHERAGAIGEAVQCYDAAVEAAECEGESAVLAEALRRRGVVHHLRHEPVLARELCGRSREVASRHGHAILAAEAINALAGFDFESGAIETAREGFHEALGLGGASAGLRGRIEQNLGILANMQGAMAEALAHYQQSLHAFEAVGDDRGRAIAYHNLGMVSADRELWDDADENFRRCLDLAESIGDVHLRGLGMLNHSEVHLARQRYELARQNAEAALSIFDRLGSKLDKADAYKVIGRTYRETGRHALAEARLRSAVELAVSTGSVLSEAEASRELALLYQAMGRNQEALTLLNAAHRLFGRLDARVDLVDVSTKVHRLEDTYFAVVRDWGQSIESSDSYTFGHCERVAGYAVGVARELALDEVQQTTIRLGAYLHDLGKVKVPHEILNKPGKLTNEEFGVIQMHPVWGVEMLATVEFPWDIKPIIRWHHEKYDGSGYPDRLRGDEIPLSAQVICIVDVYDALTTTRSYRPAMPREEALARMADSRHWWREDVYEGFLRSLDADGEDGCRPAA
ncbi:MAG TPA: HD domain-containing phosphohydrolase [Gemmatimonadales bacterium]|jgi:putative nucleotidyltransferase with HDIG domain|nr:HD domain-containing phosphohydrolase [Gemmatimonadales bacterium]